MAGADLPLFKDPESPVAAPTAAAEGRRAHVDGRGRVVTHADAVDDLVPEIARRRDASTKAITERLAAVRLATEACKLTTDVNPADLPAVLAGPLVYRTAMQRPGRGRPHRPGHRQCQNVARSATMGQ